MRYGRRLVDRNHAAARTGLHQGGGRNPGRVRRGSRGPVELLRPATIHHLSRHPSGPRTAMRCGMATRDRLIDRTANFEIWTSRFLQSIGHDTDSDERKWLHQIDRHGHTDRDVLFEAARTRHQLKASVEEFVADYDRQIAALARCDPLTINALRQYGQAVGESGSSRTASPTSKPPKCRTPDSTCSSMDGQHRRRWEFANPTGRCSNMRLRHAEPNSTVRGASVPIPTPRLWTRPRTVLLWRRLRRSRFDFN